jgi:K+-transporting ATPase KdpF subunit
MYANFFLGMSKPIAINSVTGYYIGAIIALFILVYLLWSLVKPEKF